jgi:hypothetical protein
MNGVGHDRETSNPEAARNFDDTKNKVQQKREADISDGAMVMTVAPMMTMVGRSRVTVGVTAMVIVLAH